MTFQEWFDGLYEDIHDALANPLHDETRKKLETLRGGVMAEVGHQARMATFFRRQFENG